MTTATNERVTPGLDDVDCYWKWPEEAGRGQALTPVVLSAAVRSAVASTVLVLALVCGFGAIATAATIKPGQHFAGVVNGRRSNAVIQVVCGGPISPGETGPVAGGQKVSVAKAANGRGYTGLFSQVYFWVNPPPGGARPTSMTFTSYGSSQTIPSTIQVPCGGTGQVTFSSCPYLAPCAAGWVPETIKVTFEDLAV